MLRTICKILPINNNNNIKNMKEILLVEFMYIYESKCLKWKIEFKDSEINYEQMNKQTTTSIRQLLV